MFLLSMPLNNIVTAFKVGRRSSDKNSENVTSEIVSRELFSTGFKLVGRDSSYIKEKIIGENLTWYEDIAFYTGFLSHPLSVGHFLLTIFEAECKYLF